MELQPRCRTSLLRTALLATPPLALSGALGSRGAAAQRVPGQPATLPGTRPFVVQVAWAPDGRHLAVASPNRLELWDARKRVRVREMRVAGQALSSVAWAPDSRSLAGILSAGWTLRRTLQRDQGAIKIWSAPGGQEGRAFRALGYNPEALFWTRDNVLTYSTRGISPMVHTATAVPYSIQRLHAGTGRGLQGFSSFSLAAPSPDGKRLALAQRGDPRVEVRDIASGQKLVLGWGESWGRLVFSRSGALVCHVEDSDLGRGAVRVWDAQSGKLRRTLPGPPNEGAMAISPDGRVIAAGDRTRAIVLWSVATGQKLRALKGLRVHARTLDFSPQGATLAGAGSDGRVLLWRIK